MSTIQYTITPRQVLDEQGVKYKVNGDWLGYKLCPFCGGGESGRDNWTFAVHSGDGNFNCLREGCDAKGTFWGLMLFYNMDPKKHIERTGAKAHKGSTKTRGKSKRFVYRGR